MSRSSGIRFGLRRLTAALLLASAACSGGDAGDGSNPTPTSPSATPSSSAATAATITITAAGASPRSVTVAVGAHVTFANNDTRPHDMVSNPHPDHTDCPALNQVGFLMPGQTRQTGPLTTPRTCGFHDHDRDADTSLQGTITIQ